jgi:hypothetical protein
MGMHSGPGLAPGPFFCARAGPGNFRVALSPILETAGIRFRAGEASGIDAAGRRQLLAAGRALGYDRLVLVVAFGFPSATASPCPFPLAFALRFEEPRAGGLENWGQSRLMSAAWRDPFPNRL